MARTSISGHGVGSVSWSGRTPAMTSPPVAMARSRIGRGSLAWRVVVLVGVVMAPSCGGKPVTS